FLRSVSSSYFEANGLAPGSLVVWCAVFWWGTVVLFFTCLWWVVSALTCVAMGTASSDVVRTESVRNRTARVGIASLLLSNSPNDIATPLTRRYSSRWLPQPQIHAGRRRWLTNPQGATLEKTQLTAR